MSYILDALRKSEQERNPEKVPDLGTHHRQIGSENKKSYPYWILGIALLLINGFVLFYVMSNESETKTLDIPIAKKEEKVESQPLEKPDVNTLPIIASSEPVVKKVTETPAEVSTAPVISVVATQVKPLDSSSVLDISELPYDLQRQIPDLDFSTHIFVRDGGSFIIINGKSINEGMSVLRGLRVIKILSDGIILEFKGKQFFMASMTSWVQS